MVKGYCPCCETLQPITCTGKQQAPGTMFTSQWWIVDAHKDPNKPELCEGSGRRI